MIYKGCEIGLIVVDWDQGTVEVIGAGADGKDGMRMLELKEKAESYAPGSTRVCPFIIWDDTLELDIRGDWRDVADELYVNCKMPHDEWKLLGMVDY